MRRERTRVGVISQSADRTIAPEFRAERVYQIGRVYGDRKISDSFEEWFENDILEYLRTKPWLKYAGAKLELIYDPNEED